MQGWGCGGHGTPESQVPAPPAGLAAAALLLFPLRWELLGQWNCLYHGSRAAPRHGGRAGRICGSERMGSTPLPHV